MAKEEPKAISREAAVAGVLGALNKKYGVGAVASMADHAMDIPRISTGVLEMDLALGGGIPKGRIVEFFGAEESGKTTANARCLARAQRCCVHCSMKATFEIQGTVLIKLPMGATREVPNHVIKDCPCHNPRQFYGMWQDLEGAFNPEWFEANGVWLERCYISRPGTVEEAIDIGQGVLESGQFDGLFVDSVAMGTTQEELDKSAADSSRVGGSSKQWSAAMRRWQMMQNERYRAAIAKNDGLAASLVPTIFLINQIRMKIGMFVGNPETTPGGKGIPFAASARIRTAGDAVAPKKGESDEMKDDGGEKDNPMMFHSLRFKVKKSKVSPSGYGGEYKICQQKTRFHNLGDVDQDFELIKYAVNCAIISGTQNSYYMPGVFMEDTEGKPTETPRRFRGKSEMEEYVATHKDYAEKLYDKIVAKMTGTYYDGEIRREALGEDYVAPQAFDDGRDVDVV